MIKKELEKLREMSLRQKLDYIWEYYKLHIIGTAIFASLAGMVINDMVINPPPTSALTIGWLVGNESDERLSELADVLEPTIVGYNEIVSVVNFTLTNTFQLDIARQTLFAAMTTAAELDIIIGDLAVGGRDSERLPPDVFKDLEALFYEAGVSTEGLLFYDGVAFAIALEKSPIFTELGFDYEGRYFGVIINSERDYAVLEAIRILWAGR
ncbi:MAG: hypothetical protein FWG65_05070 [Turicibacter sp.]|nr:hypothetical protein [Turicibacter sp.]